MGFEGAESMGESTAGMALFLATCLASQKSCVRGLVGLGDCLSCRVSCVEDFLVSCVVWRIARLVAWRIARLVAWRITRCGEWRIANDGDN
jgi:hypothetical protein